jgi:Peptidase M50B-like
VITKTEWHLRRWDAAWLLAYPLYQVLSTARHEGSHALAALAEGARIDRVVVVPSIVDGRFLWGYTAFSGGRLNWVVWAAPYFGDLSTVALFLPLCLWAVRRTPHAVWLNLVVIGLVAPLVNSSYQYVLAFFRPTSDVAYVLTQVPPALVHAWFVVTIPLYACAVVISLRHRTSSPRP